jgi:HAD superfamily hydrolase (TIGR01509 family)
MVMIKAIIFDLDGVLIETRKLHFDSFNYALTSCGVKALSMIEHEERFNGLPTVKKIELLRADGCNISKEKEQEIKRIKSDYTCEVLKKLVERDMELNKLFLELKDRDFKIGVASNAIRATVDSVVCGLGLEDYVDFKASNEDVIEPKPSPEIYLKCAYMLGVEPDECLVFEDNTFGIESANRAGCNVVQVKDPEDLKKHLKDFIMKQNRKLNVVIPMAGDGSRFADAGYTFPKPLIEIDKKPMIQLAIESLNIKDANYIFIVRKEHVDKYKLDKVLKLLVPDCKIVELPYKTEGALCTILASRGYIDNESPLLIANSDQFISDGHIGEAVSILTDGSLDLDGMLFTFESVHPKWSFVETDTYGRVRRVAEKDPISKEANTGIYFFDKGSEFVHYADKMIEKNVRVNGEFYVAPVYNEFIEDGKNIISAKIDNNSFWGLGTPEDLMYFLTNYKKK